MLSAAGRRGRDPDHACRPTRAVLLTEDQRPKHRRFARPTGSEKYTTKGPVRESGVIRGRYQN